ncbi:RNA-binding S4 domain-containing protein [Antrihabitans sp. YC3-6]|uniref:RNA-binding S4 domain-containing protein n=1 Tax=Antrihabitans stalagmiti TaxID=2799499 RepID=A0A934NSW4_9NOCA|nr:S4 domain-containing protein [Antrihabitans stalagmiti]MBJ8340871.1 RNA-binding S4 domain-containing protein [Antrihabitans stalagmiti]
MTTARVDSWTWAVRLFKTRSSAATAARAGHVRVNGVSVKAAHPVRIGDEVRVRVAGTERIVEVVRIVTKRVGAPIAAECIIDRSPPPPPREVLASIPQRDRGAGRPTKRDRRELDRLRGHSSADQVAAEPFSPDQFSPIQE